MKGKLTLLSLSVGLVVFGGVVQAGTSWSNYDTTVPISRMRG